MLLSVLEETRLSCCLPVMGTVEQARRRKREVRVKRRADLFILHHLVLKCIEKDERRTFNAQHPTLKSNQFLLDVESWTFDVEGSSCGLLKKGRNASGIQR
jgi:hypothetical protein